MAAWKAPQLLCWAARVRNALVGILKCTRESVGFGSELGHWAAWRKWALGMGVAPYKSFCWGELGVLVLRGGRLRACHSAQVGVGMGELDLCRARQGFKSCT